MTYYVALAVAALICYFLGSMNTAIITVFLIKRKDIREYGSGNAGLTNVYRCFGSLCAAVTVVLDVLKSILIIYGTKWFLFGSGIATSAGHDALSACLIATLAAVVGHVFPVFYRFKGGKGILIAAMCMLFSDPVVFACEAVIFFAFVGITRYISVGSMAACIGFPVFMFIIDILTLDDKAFMPMHVVIAFAIGTLCFAKHWPNIQRLRSHTENKFTIKKKSKGEV